MRAEWRLSLIALAVATGTASASAQISAIYRGNDTGGIIPWSCENEARAPETADGFCAGYGKYGRITSVNRMDGDYIAFSCLWRPDIARHQIPAARTRASCPIGHGPRRQTRGSLRE